jgi:hypothetical protein
MKLGGLFYNSKEEACPIIHITLEELGHPQPPTVLVTDNTSTATGIANDTVKQKRSKAINMRFYWTRHHAMFAKANSMSSSSGEKENSTRRITLQKVIQRHIINRFVPPIFMIPRKPPKNISNS